MDEILFTPAGVIDLLSQMDELAGQEISITDSGSGSIQIQVGESSYQILKEDTVEVQVDSAVIEEVNHVNEEAYQDLEDSGEVEISEQESVESGIVKEFLKTLLVGGVVRLAAKAIKK